MNADVLSAAAEIGLTQTQAVFYAYLGGGLVLGAMALWISWDYRMVRRALLKIGAPVDEREDRI